MKSQILYTIAILFCLSWFSMKGQNVHLSQFQASPLYLNPALGGMYYGDWQAGVSLREQWRSIDQPYQSFISFFDKKFHYFSQEFNAGLIFIHDESGNAKLTSEKIYLSLAYPIRRGRSTISIGIQPGVVMRYYNDYLTFPEQYDHSIGYFNRDLSNNEGVNYGNTNRTFFDLNAGVYWKMKLPKVTPSIGIALFQLNPTDESFNQKGDKTSIRQNIHADARFQLKNKIYLKPSYFFSGQKAANEMLVGMDAGKILKGQQREIKEIFAGLYFRNGYLRNTDSFIPVVGFQYQNWRFGFSYDITLSELDAANGNRGAMEISIIYRAPSTAPKHTAIPCERY